jgi:hypothetical protein
MVKMTWVDRRTCLVSSTPQGTDEWLEERKGKITSTAISKILGESPFFYGDDSDIVDSINGKKEEFSDEAIRRMQLGTDYEPKVRRLVEKRLGVNIRELGLAVWKRDPRFAASLDGEINEDIGIEIKCPEKMYTLFEKDGTIWRNHINQMTTAGVITGKKKMLYCVYSILEKKLVMRMIDVDYNRWNKEMYPKCIKFLDENKSKIK